MGFGTDLSVIGEFWEMSADAGIRTRVLTLARLSDNQLHYVHTGIPWIHSLHIKIMIRA